MMGIRLDDRYNFDTLGNHAMDLVMDAVAKVLDQGGRMCPCPECVTDLVAWTLNHVTPRYYTSLLSPLSPDPVVEQKTRVEIDLAIEAGLKRLQAHPHHG
jgi:competence protein ComFB